MELRVKGELSQIVKKSNLRYPSQFIRCIVVSLKCGIGTVLYDYMRFHENDGSCFFSHPKFTNRII